MRSLKGVKVETVIKVSAFPKCIIGSDDGNPLITYCVITFLIDRLNRTMKLSNMEHPQCLLSKVIY